MGVHSAAIYDCLVVVVVVVVVVAGRWSSCFYSASRRSSSTSSTHPRQFTVFITSLITCRARRSRGGIYSGHGRLCVCMSLAAFPRCYTDPDVTGER